MLTPKRRSSFEPKLRALVNSTLGDAYTTIKLACVLTVASKLLKLLRTAWMHRAGGLQALQRYIIAALAPLLKMLPFVQKQLDEEMGKLKDDQMKKIRKDLTSPLAKLPPSGQAQHALLELMKTRQHIDTQYWQPGKMTGAIYHGDLSYMAWVGEIYGMFAFTNPLHMSLHPSTRQMESEVISMVLNLYNGTSSCCGAFTTGGTESILMAMKAYRDWGRARGVASANVIVCNTAHAAFYKAGQYFDIEVREADARTPVALGSAAEVARASTSSSDPSSDMMVPLLGAWPRLSRATAAAAAPLFGVSLLLSLARC